MAGVLLLLRPCDRREVCGSRPCAANRGAAPAQLSKAAAAGAAVHHVEPADSLLAAVRAPSVAALVSL